MLLGLLVAIVGFPVLVLWGAGYGAWLWGDFVLNPQKWADILKESLKEKS